MHVDLDSKGNYAGPVEIYQLTAPNGKQYIGQAQCHRTHGKKWAAKGFKGRWREHRYEAAKGKNQKDCRLLYHSLRKYGPENFKTEVLLRVSKHLANHYEAKFIKTIGTLSPYGLNLQEGGGTTVFSEESRKKLSESAKRRVYTAEHGAQMSARKRAARLLVSKLPILVSYTKARPSDYVSEGYMAVVKHDNKVHKKVFCSKALPLPEKLRLAVEARDRFLKDLGLPAITDDPVIVN